MANKPSLASLLDKPLPGYPVLDIRADPVQTIPASPTSLTLSQEFEFDVYSLYAQSCTPSPGTPAVSNSEEAHDDDNMHAGTAHTPDIA